MESEYTLEKVEKVCPACGKPLVFIKSWVIEAKAKRGPRLKISLYKCDCGPHRVVEKEVESHE